MQQKYGNQHFNFLSDSFIIPEEKQALIEKMEQEPGSMWIVKPPGKWLRFQSMTWTSEFRQKQWFWNICDR